MEVHRLFSTPVIHLRLSTHDQHVFNYPKRGELKSNKPVSWVGAVRTSFPRAEGDDFIDKEQLEKLKSDIIKEIEVAFLYLNITSKFRLDEFWYNIYDKGFGQEMHDHLSKDPITDPLWSGVYYHKNCESIPTIFSRSDSNYRCQLFDGWIDSQIADTLDKQWSTQVKDGDIILFPPYLMHYVYCDNEDEEMRVTFSFNVDRTNEDICKEAWDREQGGTQPPEMPS